MSSDGGTLQLDTLHGVVTVTMAYFMLFFLFIGVQVKAHISRTPTDKNGAPDNDAFRRSGAALDPFCVMADRTVGNTIEQMVPFLTTMWLHAVFVDAHVSTVLGSIYVAARALYPLVWSFTSAPVNQRPPKSMIVSTFPGYAITYAFILSLILKTTVGFELVAFLSPFGVVIQSVALMVAGFSLSGLLFFTGKDVIADILERGFPSEGKRD